MNQRWRVIALWLLPIGMVLLLTWQVLGTVPSNTSSSNSAKVAPMNAAVARVPAKGEFRGNLAAGASAVARSLTEKDQWICEQVGPKLKDLGLVLVGLDIIGDYLTEINVTSPTCFREYESLCDINVALSFLDAVEELQKNV